MTKAECREAHRLYELARRARRRAEYEARGGVALAGTRRCVIVGCNRSPKGTKQVTCSREHGAAMRNIIRFGDDASRAALLALVPARSEERKLADRNRRRARRWKTGVAEREQHRQRTKRLRMRVISAYGGACACCGETNYEFLAIDHVGGGGARERRTVPALSGTYSFCKHIEALGFPSCYRVLCHNCNMARGFYGRCPHESISLVSMMAGAA